MEAKLLSITHYDETGWKWHNERTRNPVWEQAEKSIRRMDRFRRPFVHLQAGVQDTDFLAVCDGGGVCAPSAVLNDSYPNYFDASKSDDEIAVWTSDQGYHPEEKYVCYAQFGELSSAVLWQ